MSDINYFRGIESLKQFMDFLNNLIPRDEVERICNFSQELNSRTFTENYELSYSEKCNIVLDKFFDSDFCSESSSLPEHIEAIEKLDSDTVENLELFFSDKVFSDKAIIPSNLIKYTNYLLNNKEYVEELLNDDSTSSQQKELIRQCFSGKTKIDIENFRILCPTLEDVKDLQKAILICC